MADRETLRLARRRGLDHRTYLADYDAASFFKALGQEIKTDPSGTNVADITLVLIEKADRARKIAVIFGGEATVDVKLAEGKKPGFGGRNSHLTLLATEKLDKLE